MQAASPHSSLLCYPEASHLAFNCVPSVFHWFRGSLPNWDMKSPAPGTVPGLYNTPVNIYQIK